MITLEHQPELVRLADGKTSRKSKGSHSFVYGCLLTFCALSLSQYNGLCAIYGGFGLTATALADNFNYASLSSLHYYSPSADDFFAPVKRALCATTLKAESSLVSGVVDADTLTASMYWTLDLKNSSKEEREASADLILPPGAVVHRATLWVHGKAEEASFASSWRVQDAYNWVVDKHRDPLLVTWKDDRTISIKAAPVPEDGTPMRIRLGITMPLVNDTKGEPQLELPKLIGANFALPTKNDIHLESAADLYSRGEFGRVVRSASGMNVFKANGNETDMCKIKIASKNNLGKAVIAVDATHSEPGVFIYAAATGDTQGEALDIFRSREVRNAHWIKDQDAAARLSTLWAAKEASRRFKEGRGDIAEDLAATYRIITPVSGAVVLESEYDYQRNGLDRNLKRITRYDELASLPSASAEPTYSSAPILQGATSSILLPPQSQLQGATNGTIGPQGADATVVQGVNTAGTVRVNQLENIQAIFSALASATDISFFLASMYFLFKGVLAILRKEKDGLTMLVLAATLNLFSAIWLVALPFIGLYELAIKLAGKKQGEAI